jgi:hypothetical protein
LLIYRLQSLLFLTVILARLSKSIAFTTVNNGLSFLSAIGNSLNIRIYKVIDQQTRELIDRLLLEPISLAGIARAIQISQQWLQTYVNEKYAGVPRSVD